MFSKIDYCLEHFDEPSENIMIRFMGFVIWMLILSAFSGICLGFAYIFGGVLAKFWFEKLRKKKSSVVQTAEAGERNKPMLLENGL